MSHSHSQPLISISILDTTLKLLRLPRISLEPCAYPLIRTLWFRSSNKAAQRFFSFTVNTLEVSVFAESDLVQELYDGLQDLQGHASGVEISAEDWSALQVESHDEEPFEDSGKRVRDLAKPLAANGISILFKSTYFSDFILCKQARLEMVCEILQQTSGFEFHASSDGSEDELVSPVSADCSIHSRSIPMARSFTGSLLLDKSRSSPSNEPSPEISPTKSRPTSLRSQSQASDDLPTTMNQLRMQPLDQNQESPTHSEHDPDEVKTDNEALAYSVHSEGSLNLTASLYLLPDELVCVGLDVSMEKIWREKLVKALFYSVDVLDENQREQRNDRRSTSVDPGTSGSRSRQRRSRTYQTLAEESRSPTFVPTGTAPTALQDAPVPFFSFTATSDNASLVLDVRLLRTLFVEDEQHMLFTVGGEGVSGQFQGELGTMDARKGRAAQNVSGSEARGRTGRFSATEDWTPDEANIESGRHIMKCLQLDLSSFGLDKKGIVNIIGETLSSGSVMNMLYSSTYSTACVLVSKQELAQARESLEQLP